MNKFEDIDQKIANLLSGKYTEQEKKDVEEWVKISKDNHYQFHKLQEFWQNRILDPKLINHESLKLKIWTSFQNEEKKPKPAERRFLFKRKIWRAAAIILLLVLPSILFVVKHNFDNSTREVIVNHKVVKRNPSGQKTQIQLPDGSKVWLNAESTLTYFENFSTTTRSVKLEGEAFFEINRDTLRPFFVETDKIKVGVFGTEFNVNAYEDDPEIVVALVHGSVKVSMISKDHNDNKEILLSPGYAISISRDTESYSMFSLLDDTLSYERITSWKTGTLVFNGVNFKEFINEISRWYGVEVSVHGIPPKDWHIRASFKNEYLNNILDAISFNKDFEYELKNKKLKLMFH